MQLTIPRETISLKSATITSSTSVISSVLKEATKRQPKTYDYKSACELAFDLDTLQEHLQKQLDGAVQAILAARGLPHGHSDMPIVKVAESLAQEVAIAKSLDANGDVSLPDIDTVCGKLSDYSDVIDHQLSSLNKKKLKLMAKAKDGFALSLTKLDDLSFLNDEPNWEKLLPAKCRKVVDPTLFKATLGKPTFDAHSKANSPERLSSILVTQISKYLDQEALIASKRRKAAATKTRDEKLANITKRIAGDLA